MTIKYPVRYPFEDPDVEALTAAQTQMLRFGPRNVRRIQEVVGNIGLALGIPVPSKQAIRMGRRQLRTAF